MRALAALVALACVGYLAEVFVDRRSSGQPNAAEAAQSIAGDPPPASLGLERIEPVAGATRIAEPAPASEPPVLRESASSRSHDVEGILRGRVVDDLGTPVPTFAILATRLTNRRPAALDPKSDVWKLFQGTDGTFALENLSPGEWELTARRPASVRSPAVVASAPTSGNDVVLVLPRPASIAGIVENEAGDPIPRARVYVWNAGEAEPDFLGSGDETKEDARADEDGRFRLDDVQPGSPHVLARHPEFGDSEGIVLEIDPGQRKEDLRLTLKRGGRVEGIVAASVGPAEHRRVALYSHRGLSGWRDTRTDDAGRFVIEGVLPQDYVIQLHPPDRPSNPPDQGADDARSIRKRISVRDGQTTRVVFDEPEQGIVIHGSVTGSGVPFSGCRVTVSRSDRESMGRIDQPIRTDSEGRFSLSVEGPGGYLFMIEEKQGSYAFFERVVPDAREVEESFEVPAGRIFGRVLGGGGEGLGRVPVTVFRSGGKDDGKPWRSLRRASTAQDGSFEFGLLQDGSYDVRAPDGDQGNAYSPPIPYGRVVIENKVVHVGDPATPLELRLVPEGWISGQVLDAKGHGVANMNIQVRNGAGVSLSAFGETRTDATGFFLVSNVAAGTYTVLAKGGGKAVESGPVVVQSGRTATTKLEVR